MTFCVAFKIRQSAFLVADSAVASTSAIAPSKFSSFSELNVETSDRSVQQGALKIFNLGSVSISGAGRPDLLTQLAFRTETFLQHNRDVLDAFRSAALSMTPLSNPQDLQAAAIWTDPNRESHVASFNLVFDQLVEEHFDNQAVVIGRVDGAHRSLIKSVVQQAASTATWSAQQITGIIVCVCQCFGVHSHPMEKGIDGPFCGAFTDPKLGISWCPDLSYFLYDGRSSKLEMGKAVAVYVRDDVAVCISCSAPRADAKVTLRMDGLPQPRDSETELETERRAALAMESARATLFDEAPAYVCFIDVSQPKAIIIELDGRWEHKHLRIDRFNVQSGIRRVHTSTTLNHFLLARLPNQQGRDFYFLPAEKYSDPSDTA